MDLINHFADHHHHLLYLIAGISFVIELTVLGLSGPLLFFAMAAFVTGVLVNIGVLSGWESELFTLGILTGLIAVFLWKPLKKFQSSGGGRDTSSDMIGLEVLCVEDLNSVSGKIRYSGINWNARVAVSSSEQLIPYGTRCRIDAVEGNTMIVTSIIATS